MLSHEEMIPLLKGRCRPPRPLVLHTVWVTVRVPCLADLNNGVAPTPEEVKSVHTHVS